MGCTNSEIIQLRHGLQMGDGAAEQAGGRRGGKNLPAPRRELGRGQSDVSLGITFSSSSGHIALSSKGEPEHKVGARISQKKRTSLIFFLIFALFLQPRDEGQAKLAACSQLWSQGVSSQTEPLPSSHIPSQGTQLRHPTARPGIGAQPLGLGCPFLRALQLSPAGHRVPRPCRVCQPCRPSELSSGHTVAAFIRFSPRWMLSWHQQTFISNPPGAWSPSAPGFWAGDASGIQGRCHSPWR